MISLCPEEDEQTCCSRGQESVFQPFEDDRSGIWCGTTYAFVRSHEQSWASGFCNLHDGSIPRSDDRAGAPHSFHGEAVGVLIKSVVKTAPRLDHKESA
jgi:hypothetical protein